MKLGLSTFTCPDWDLQTLTDTASELGYQGIEFRCGGVHNHGVEIGISSARQSTVRDALETNRLEACCLATGLQFSQDGVHDDAEGLIELASGINCRGIRVFCGPIPEGRAIGEVVEKVGRQLRVFAELADQAQVQVWLETHDNLSHGVLASKAVRMSAHPAVGIVYDNLHPFRKGEATHVTLAAIQGLVRLVHFHDGINSKDKLIVRPFGQGDLPIDEMFRGIVLSGFGGYVVAEWFGNMYGIDPAEALRHYHQQITEVAQRCGVKFGA